MSASTPNTPSAMRSVRFASKSPLKDLKPKSIQEACVEAYSSGIETLHSCIRSNRTVTLDLKVKFISALKKHSEKSAALKRFSEPDFVPHTIRFKASLKTDKASAERGEFKELSNQFDATLLETRDKLKQIMFETRKIELEERKKELFDLASSFIIENAEEIFIIQGHAESPTSKDHV